MNWEKAETAAIDDNSFYLVQDNGHEWRDFDLSIMRGVMIRHKMEPSYIRGRPEWIAKIVRPATLSSAHCVTHARNARSSAGTEDATISAIHDALAKANLEYSGYSCNGVNLVGDKASVKAAMTAFHSHSKIDWYQTNLRHWREECGKLHAKLAQSPSAAQPSGVTDEMVLAGAIGIVQDVADHDGGPSFHEMKEQSQHEALTVSRACLTAALAISSTHQPCPGCDGHECDDGCQYPGAQSSPDQGIPQC